MDLAGQPLDGNGDGTSGDDYVQDFAVRIDNLLANPNFDDDLAGWTASSPAEMTHGPDDVSGAPTSGSAVITNLTGAGHTMTLAQCVPVDAWKNYFVSGWLWIDSGLATDPTIFAAVDFYGGVSCGGTFLGTEEIPPLVGDTIGGSSPDGFESGDTSVSSGFTGADEHLAGWEQLAGTVQAPSGAVSARVRYVFEAGASPDFTAKMDDVQFFLPLLFKDGFETGDTSRWSETMP